MTTKVLNHNQTVLSDVPPAHKGPFLGILERFNESTERLESRHRELQAEIESLRAELQKKEAEIRQNARLAMLGETAAGLAHEIRNPLGAIALFVSMLKEDISDRSDSLSLLGEIEKSIKSLDAVVSNVLHFAQERVGTAKVCNAHSIIQELVQHFSSLYSPQCALEADLQGSPFYMGDEQGIRQALYNLIINALQAVSFAGCITIRAYEEQETLVIEVQDDGPGVPEDIRANIFEPFTSGRSDGTGLGLSIVRRIVEAHQGTIALEGESTTLFKIRLPKSSTQKEEI